MPAKRFRPKNFQFPIGLSTIVVSVSGPTINAATNSTGGTITMDGSNAVHRFTSSGTFVSGFDQNVEYLVVAGGGGGGGFQAAGGGGAGGLRYGSNFPVTASTPLTVTIGGGGAGGENSGDSRGANGTNSVFSSIQSHGGGGGGSGNTPNDLAIMNGKAGGSGGGAHSYSTTG